MSTKAGEKLALREKIGYGLGDAASSIFWKLFSMYLLFFYTDVFGIPAAVVGTMFLISRVWDALNDPIMGLVADRTQTRWGKFRPYLLFGAIPFGVLGVLTFTTPELGTTGKIVYAYITYTLMMMVYTVVNVPYASLLGVMSADTRQRNQLSSYRMIFAFAGGFLALLLIEPMVDNFSRTASGIDLQRGWTGAVAVFAVITTVFFYLTFRWTRERVRPVAAARNPLRDDLRDLVSNRPWWILLVGGIAALIFNSIRDGAAVFYFKYFVTANEGAFSLPFMSGAMSYTTLFLVLGQAANIAGIILAAPIANRYGKKPVFIAAMTGAALLSVAFWFLGGSSIAAMMVLQVLISMCAGSVFPLLWSMYADIADYSELKTGRRATGLVFSSSSMSQKFGWTLGGAISGWLLGYFGFQANVEQTETAVSGIRLMVSILPALGAALSVIVLSFYPLSEKKMRQVGAELEKMRKQ